MDVLTPATELEAVNLILRNMGEAPVSSLNGEIPLDAAKARDSLRDVSRQVQKQGWFWNSETFTLVPDSSGEIPVPPNTLEILASSVDRGQLWTIRKGKIYNMTPKQTGYRFDRSVCVTLIMGLDFDELPETARDYIAMRAARVFQAQELGDDVLLREDTEEENRAMAVMKAQELRARRATIRNTQSVHRVLTRRPLGYSTWR